MNQDAKYQINRINLHTLRNRQEQRVIEAMRKLLPQAEDFCGCRICMEDIYAAALSKLPAQYVPNGSLVVRRVGPSDSDIEQIVHGVLDQVRLHPNHSQTGNEAR
ncbi:MAG: late competence development ComFB family protein [Candidatus Lambdaproteobacteria bacterium]|nr:late competence development ComFB family protein [Candidatus Lambdaproteobacteria bacterium]